MHAARVRLLNIRGGAYSGLRTHNHCCRTAYAWKFNHVDKCPQVRVSPLLQRRSLAGLALPVFLLPPVFFVGLVVTLWTYKSFMMVLFQNKIIYMRNLPPLSRQEKVESYTNQCHPVRWIERQTRASDGTLLAVLQGAVDLKRHTEIGKDEEHLVVLYFQGNASSMPPRLPFLSDTLNLVQKSLIAKATHNTSMKISLVALSYRGYWKSHGRPSGKGIELDAQAGLQWILQNYKNAKTLRIVLWGQSIGGGVATTTAAHYLESKNLKDPKPLLITGMILETPFTSVRDLLVAFYPQKWLPYRYLTPFLRSHWDSEDALRRIANTNDRQKPKVLLLEGGKDEIVPQGQAKRLEDLCTSLHLPVKRVTVAGALHNETSIKYEGRKAIAGFLLRQIDCEA
ncbi:Alpha/Beta hydrolase protein [Talaromyces proteolyticus]|uniref:Alpha/Beta hydrolase protein n=1 Tax=Talaromyces proteolyticus TaxID=1131652 RepID=A0AAD4KTD5_9EURO|nr:Alpha/Beta hydrolase protein [Talaromyces proteolyticus]KAH8700558.1 Alpha/Beta hydrolase protein [Talaromyces proteolyticus]